MFGRNLIDRLLYGGVALERASDTAFPMNIPNELKAYFEFTFINCFALCHYCGNQQGFSSDAKEYSDEWYLDMAAAIKRANWIIPKRQVAACPGCASELQLHHDPSAFSE